jgi:phosphoglycerate dehydrogenase-like enzyme
MASPCVLEFVRSREAVWTLSERFVEELKREFPDLLFLSPRDQDEADERLPEAEIVLGWAVTRKNFHRASRLRWIQVTAAGVGHQLFPELIESPVVLTNGRGIHGIAIAEHTLGVMLAFARKLHLARDAQHERRWAQLPIWQDPPPIGELGGTKLGLVGFGAIGQALAPRAMSLGIEVTVVRRRPQHDPMPGVTQWGKDRLPELLERSDWVVLATALTQETKGLIDRAALARMKPSAILINVGRGSIVDQDALVEALENGRLGGAGLDVTHPEPLPADHPLWTFPNVILTPHISGVGPRYWQRAMDIFRHNLHAYLKGEPLMNVVDKQAGY